LFSGLLDRVFLFFSCLVFLLVFCFGGPSFSVLFLLWRAGGQKKNRKKTEKNKLNSEAKQKNSAQACGLAVAWGLEPRLPVGLWVGLGPGLVSGLSSAWGLCDLSADA